MALFLTLNSYYGKLVTSFPAPRTLATNLSEQMKRYIPPRERRAWKKLRVSTVGFGISILMSLTAISLISAVQSLWYTEKVQAQELQIPKITKISDNVVASKASPSIITQTSTQTNYSRIDLTTLPIERNWPVRGRLTTYFSRYHPAIDIATAKGTPIRPYATGVVTASGYSGGFGKRIIVVHNNGIETTYAHLDTLSVHLGQTVGVDTILGTVGSTGRSTGPHLHFQVLQNGSFINPLTVLP